MEISWLVGTGAALVGGGLCFWIWRARRSGHARDAAISYLIGDQVAGGPGRGHQYDYGGGWHDSGGGDSGGGDAGGEG